MADFVIIDTDILIDFGLDRKDAVETLAKLEDQFDLKVSVITALELYAGCRSKRDLNSVDDLLLHFSVEHLSKNISELSFNLMREFRSSHGVEINDMLIAATALYSEAKFISKNQKHYRFLPNLDLFPYPFL